MLKPALHFALATTLTIFSAALTGCGGADASAPTDPSGDEEDLTKAGPLSQDLVCAAVGAFNDLGDPTGLTSVAEKDLTGDALKDFKSFQKGMASDYPSEAYKLPVKFKNKTYTFLMVQENNDGGTYAGIYRLDGRTVATFSQSESGDPNWSSPADKCQ